MPTFPDSSDVRNTWSLHKGLRILVAEDNATNQMVITKILERGGHHPTVVQDGHAALETLGEQSFDLAIVDIRMPGISGLEVMKLHRFTEPDGSCPSSCLTADATTEAAETCIDEGANAFLTKPVHATKLLEVVDRVVAGQHESPDPRQDASPLSAQAPHRRTKTVIDPDRLDELRALERASPNSLETIVETFKEDAGELVTRRSSTGARRLPATSSSGSRCTRSKARPAMPARKPCMTSVKSGKSSTSLLLASTPSLYTRTWRPCS